MEGGRERGGKEGERGEEGREGERGEGREGGRESSYKYLTYAQQHYLQSPVNKHLLYM